MKLIIFILNKEEHLEEILEAFVELGINGATILDSIGMGRILAHDIPIFAGFQNLLHDTRPGNKTILSVVPEKKIERIVQAVEQIIGSLDEPGNGLFISLPVDLVKGYNEL
jgi:nitrogen regulatory protein PII